MKTTSSIVKILFATLAVSPSIYAAKATSAVSLPDIADVCDTTGFLPNLNHLNPNPNLNRYASDLIKKVLVSI